MANPDALVWGGVRGETAEAGKGAAFIIENQGAQILTDYLSQVEEDRRKIEQADKARALHGKQSDVELTGWDVDIQRQLGGQYNDLRQDFIDSYSAGMNPLDPKNVEAFTRHSQLLGRLKADMKTSVGQQEFYEKQHTVLTQDKGRDYNWKKSMANLEKYRNASIADREKMGANLLIPIVASDSELIMSYIDMYEKQTNQGKSYIDENGDHVTTEIKGYPIKEMKQLMLNDYYDTDENGRRTDNAEVMRSHFKDEYQMIDLFNKIVPKEEIKVTVKAGRDGDGAAMQTAIQADERLINDMIENVKNAPSFLLDKKIEGVPITNVEYVKGEKTAKRTFGIGRPHLILTLSKEGITEVGEEKKRIKKRKIIWLDSPDRGFAELWGIVQESKESKKRIHYSTYLDLQRDFPRTKPYSPGVFESTSDKKSKETVDKNDPGGYNK